MEYAIQLLLPILGGLWLGNWLTRTYHLASIWTMVLAILGMVAGLGILYKRYALMPRVPFRPVSKPKVSSEKQLELHELDFLYKIDEESSSLKKTSTEKDNFFDDDDDDDDDDESASKQKPG